MKAPTIPWRGAPLDHDGQDPDTREDTMAKGQMRSNREKKKPKADKNKNKNAPAAAPFTPFTPARPADKDVRKKF